jgi:hypothetical protein
VKKTAALWQQLDVDGYKDRAVEALGRVGYNAWEKIQWAISPLSRLMARHLFFKDLICQSLFGLWHVTSTFT